MNSKFRYLAIPVVLALLAAGCGGSDDDAGSDGTTADATDTGSTDTGSTDTTTAVTTEDLSGAVETDEEPVQGGTLVYATDVQPTAGGLDPYVAQSFASQNIVVQIYEGLLSRSDDGEVIPALAESWEQADDVTYTFTLRDTTFHDGSPLTAADVVFSIATSKAGNGAGNLAMVDTVTAIDDHTVEFKLAYPSASFINVMSFAPNSPIVSEAWYTSTDDTSRQTTANGTGPFMLDEWQDGVVVKLKRNPNYWDQPKPYLDAIEFPIYPDETARYAALSQGGDVQAGWFRDFHIGEQSVDAGMHLGQNAQTRSLNLYMNLTDGPLSDLKVRQALSMGFDRELVIELASQGTAIPTLVVPAGEPGALAPDGSTPNYAYDPDQAMALLDEAGQPNPTIEVTYASDQSFALDVPMLEAMKEQLSAVGIDLQLNPIPWADVLGQLTTGAWSGMILAPGVALADPTSYFNFVLPDFPYNLTGDATAGEMLQAAMAETDPDARTQQLDDLQTYIAENVLILIPYTQTQRQEVWTDALLGYSADPYTWRIHLKDAWLASS